MTGRPSERFVWASQAAAVRPADRILEVGSGHGILARLLAAQLDTGRLAGLDRSAKMTAVASRTNADLVRAGRATFVTGKVQKLDPQAATYDLVIAARVREIWTDPIVLPLIRRTMSPRGRLLLVVDSPKGVVAASTFRAIRRRLNEAGFEHLDAHTHKLASGEATAIEARL